MTAALVSTCLISVAPPGAAATAVPAHPVTVKKVTTKKAKRKVDPVRAVPVSANKVRIIWPGARSSKRVLIKVAKNSPMTVGIRKYKGRGSSKVIKIPASNPGWTWFFRVLKPGGGWLSGVSALRQLNLKVGNINDLSVSSPQSRGLELQWTPPPNVQNYRVAVSTDPSMSNAAVYNISTGAGRYAPPNLNVGTKYYFTVQPSNARSTGAVASASGAMNSRLSDIVAGTYNIAGGTSLPKDNTRLNLLADQINEGGFDFVSLEEAPTEMTGSLLARLPDYTKTTQVLAAGYNNTGGQILYKPRVLRPLSTKGILLLPDNKAASYQLFQKISDGAQFFAVEVHLTVGPKVSQANLRKAETQTLLNGIRAVNPSNLPVIYAGDFNSHFGLYKSAYDAPYQVMNDNRIADSVDNATTVINHNFNSANQLSVKPPTGGYHVDHIFVQNGVTAVSWKVMTRMSGNQYATPFASDHNPVRLAAQIPF